jgi:beta-N-acetylhexosaminidase
LGNKAVIFGLQGVELSDVEREFFVRERPLGFILFKRNIESPAQVKKLVRQLKECVEWDCPILIDQEGGRVARLKPPHWRNSPAVKYFADLAEKDMESAKEAAYMNARLIGEELYSLGINVDCAPVCDLVFDGAHDIIGDRSFGSEPEKAATLARQMAQGLADSGVLPIIKHIPGHGRARVDSHESLPVVDASLAELRKTDFVVFSKLADIPWAMTAHITYTAIDAEHPATLSPKVINIIRNEIGFDGIIISDDLSMKALQGTFTERAEGSIKAGCDLVLHCNGDMAEMLQVAAGACAIDDKLASRLEKGFSFCSRDKQKSIDIRQAEENLQLALGR